MSNKSVFDDSTDLGRYRASRNWLVPYLLLILRNYTMHGYDLMARLTEFGITTIDQGTIYRTLRMLEKEGHVESTWEHSESGPSRRVYSITDAGNVLLDTWFGTMEFYQGLVNNFIDFYQTTLSEVMFPHDCLNIKSSKTTPQNAEPVNPDKGQASSKDKRIK